MPKVRLARVARLFARVAEIALGDHPKCPDGGQRAALIPIQFVPMIAIYGELTLESARKFQAVEKHIPRVAVARIPVSLANVVVAIPRVVIARIGSPRAPEFDPMDLEVTRVLITISRIRPTVHKHLRR
jgi:hypothetical protein